MGIEPTEVKPVKRLNKKFVTWLTLGVMFIVTIIIAIAIRSTAPRDPMLYAEKAEKQFASGDYKEALKNFNAAYRYSKKDPKWLIKVGEVLYQDGDIGRAIGTLQTAVTADPALIPAQKRLVEIFFEMGGRSNDPGFMKRLQEESEKLVGMIPEKSATDNETKSNLAIGLHARGVSRYGLRSENPKNVELARADIEKAITLDSKTDYVQSLAMISIGEAQQMIRLASQRTITPDAYQEYLKKMEGYLADAEKIYLSLLKGHGEKIDALTAVGNFYFQIRARFERALVEFCSNQELGIKSTIVALNRQLELIDANKQMSSDDKRRTRQRANNELVSQRRSIPAWRELFDQHTELAKKYTVEAETYYKQAVAITSGDKEQREEAMLSYANYLIAEEKFDNALGFIDKVISLNSNGYQGYRLKSAVLKRQASDLKDKPKDDKTSGAISILEKRLSMPHEFKGINGRSNRAQMVMLQMALTEMYMDRNKDGDLGKVDKLLVDLGQDQTLANPVMVEQLKARRAVAGTDMVQAIQHAEKADTLSSGRDPGVKLMLAQLYTQKGEFGAAKKVIDETMQMAPDSVSALRLAAMVSIRLGDYVNGLTYLDRLLNVPGQEKDTAVLSQRLECLVRLNRMEEANSVAKKLQDLGSKINWNVVKGRIFMEQGNSKEAETLFRKALVENPGDREPAIYLSDLYGRQNKISEAKKVIQEAIVKNPDDKGLKRVLELLAIDDPQKRRERLQSMTTEASTEQQEKSMTQAEETKDPFERAVRLFEEYFKKNEMDKAEAQIKEAVKINPDKATMLQFRFALIRKKWDDAQKCTDLAKVKNLDSLKGFSYEAELNSARGWSLLMDDKKPEEAKRYFEKSAKACEQILSDLPNDSQARALLGEAYYWLDRRDEAYTQISRAIDLSPTNAYALRSLSIQQWDSIVRKGNAVTGDEMRAFVNTIQQVSRQMPWDQWTKDKVAYLEKLQSRQQALQADEKEDIKKVLSHREKIYTDNATDVDNILRLGWIYENRKEVKDLDKAKKFYEQAIQKAPKTEMLQMYLVFANRNKMLDDAEKFLKGFAEEQSKEKKSVGYSLLGFYYMAVNQVQEAEKAFLQAATVEDTPEKRLDVAVFYGRINNSEKVIEWARKALLGKLEPEQEKMARTMLINSYLAMNNWESAKEQIDGFLKSYPKESTGKLFQARLQVGLGSLSESERILTEILTASPENMDALDIRSKVYIYGWQLEKARTDLLRMQKINPQSFGLNGQIQLVKLFCEMGQSADAFSQARTLIEDARSQPQSFDVIRTQLLPALSSAAKDKEYEELLIWAGNTYRASPLWPYELGQYYMLKSDYGKAKSALSGALELSPKEAEGLKILVLDSMFKAMVYSRQYGEVIRKVDSEMAELKKEVPQLMFWQVVAYYKNGQKEKAMSVFLKAMDKVENPMLAWELTENLLTEGILAGDLDKFLSEQKGSNKDSVKLAMAKVKFAANQIEQGATMYQSLYDSAKEDQVKLMYLYFLSQEYSKKQKYDQAVTVLKTAIEKNSNNVALLNNLAYIQEEYLNQAKEAKLVIDKAYRTDSNNPDLLDTYGQILVKTEDKPDMGIIYLARSVWIKESSASRYHLGAALLKQNRPRDAQIQLNRALQIVGEDKTLEKDIRALKQKI